MYFYTLLASKANYSILKIYRNETKRKAFKRTN